MSSTLILTLGGRGGTGKTLSLVAIADYLRKKGNKLVAIDCDTENAGKLSSFSHWFNGRAHPLNLRNLGDCDKLLKSSATSGVPFVLADLPANSSADISDWWKDVATPDVLNELGLTIIGVGTVTASHGAAESVVEWMSSLGESISYLVILNRISFERVPRPKEEAFSDWFLVNTHGLHLKTLEIGHLHLPTMDALVRSAKLPSKAIEGTDLFVLDRQRVKSWRDRIHAQLESLGIFPAQETTEPAPALK